MASDERDVRRRRPLRRLKSAAVRAALPLPVPDERVAPDPIPVGAPEPEPARVETSFVCPVCRREMALSERSRIARAKCRACV
jgi:hypothetical protein